MRGANRLSTELTAEEYEALDDADFEDLLEWDRRRTNGGPVRLGDYSVREVLARLSWLKCYALRLRARLRESKSASRMTELERECARLTVRLANYERQVERIKGERGRDVLRREEFPG